MKHLLIFACTIFCASLSSAQSDCNIIYVTPTGGGLIGSISAPASLASAFDINISDPDRNVLFLQEGNYNINETIVIPSGLTIEGGYQNTGDGWQKSSALTSVINVNPPVEVVNGFGHRTGILLSGTNNVVLRDLNIYVNFGLPAGNVGNNGVSIYGVRIINSNNYVFERCQIFTGHAGDGLAGSNGAPGNSGGQGLPGQVGCDGCSGNGFGGNGGGGGNIGGEGGRGAYGNNTGQPGQGGFGVGGGAGGNGGNGTGGFCAFGCSNAGVGQNGGGGLSGAAGSSGSNATAGVFNNAFFVPSLAGNGQTGIAGGGGGGAGGGGGTDCCLDDRGGGGGGGGGGGFGGAGGTGGGSGGSSVALLTWNNGANGELRNVTLTPGNSGNGSPGGSGGQGGSGGSGGQGGFGPDNGGNGGNGGPGGSGGQGGAGGTGANGQSLQLFESGSLLEVSNDGFPYAEIYTAKSLFGCTNSIVNISKSAGNWDLAAMQANAVDDVLPGESSFDPTVNATQVYYLSQGPKDLVTELSTINDFFSIRDNRPLPMIDAIPDSICAESGLVFSTPTGGLEHTWSVLNESGTTVATRSGMNPAEVELNPGKYFLRLSVRDECCGWSIPVYDSTFVKSRESIIDLVNICQGDSVFIDGAMQTESGIYPQVFIDGNGCEVDLLSVLILDPCVEFGCTDEEAINYQPLAINDDGSCVYNNCADACGPGLHWDGNLQLCIISCPADLNQDGVINSADLSIFLGSFGTTCADI